MGSLFYVEDWPSPTLVLWLIGVLTGAVLMLGAKSRFVGRSVLTGTLLGAGAFVLLLAVLVFTAPI
jgi:hypothetical protein